MKPYQVLPTGYLKRFINDKINLHSKLNSRSDIYEQITGAGTANPYPFALSKPEVKTYGSIQKAIYTFANAITNNYHKDKRIQQTYKFNGKVKDILELYRNKPYSNLGSYRPDFLFESKTCIPKVCEINARFPMNGYFMTYFGYDLLPSSESYTNGEMSVQPIDGIKYVKDSFDSYFDMKKPIVALRDKEDGYDIHFFKQLNKNVIPLKPSEIRLKSHNGNNYLTNANGSVRIDQVLFELHQSEILKLNMDVIGYIVNSCKHLNDLRTVFILHDKRFLTLISRDDVLQEYLPPQQCAILKEHFIHSILPSTLHDMPNKLDEIMSNKSEWLIKPCLLGKGAGIKFGKDLENDEWKQLIGSCVRNDEFIIQKHIKQEKFHILKNKGSIDIEWVNHNVVGTLLCFDDKFIGPGIFRTSGDDLIALSRGGSLLYPAEVVLPEKDLKSWWIEETPVFEKHKLLSLPDNCKFRLSSKSLINPNAYKDALVKFGFALLQLDFKDSDFLLSLVKQLGIPLAHSNKGDDYVWDICPGNSSAARSHTNKEFPMHTDASFESNTNIPRYFALEVVQNDRNQTGQSLFIPIDDVVNSLTRKSLNILLNEYFKFKIPKEFKTTLNEYTSGKILSKDRLQRNVCRYRSELIMNKDEMSIDVQEALNEFDKIIRINESNLIKYCQIKSNCIILVDNCRWLHARTEITDTERYIRRVRFQTNDRILLPNFT